MGKFTKEISEAHQNFIEQQHIYFVASAPLTQEGHVNVSPKGLDSFRVLGKNKVAYLDLISSGNETSAHILENGRITIMFCSFEKNPNILRLYGKGKTILPNDSEWETYAPFFEVYPSSRQIIVAEIDLVQTSCGFGVPMFDFIGHRDIHFEWAEKKGSEKLSEYIDENNLISLDGLPTPLGIERKK